MNGNITIRQFDIVMVDLGVVIGSEQGKVRPCVVVQNDTGNKYSPTTIIIPLTHIIKNTSIPTHTVITTDEAMGLKVDSMVLGEQVKVIDKQRIKYKYGKIICEEAKDRIEDIISVSFRRNRKQDKTA